jgi:hypothetical protein
MPVEVAAQFLSGVSLMVVFNEKERTFSVRSSADSMPVRRRDLLYLVSMVVVADTTATISEITRYSFKVSLQRRGVQLGYFLVQSEPGRPYHGAFQSVCSYLMDLPYPRVLTIKNKKGESRDPTITFNFPKLSH